MTIFTLWCLYCNMLCMVVKRHILSPSSFWMSN